MSVQLQLSSAQAWAEAKDGAILISLKGRLQTTTLVVVVVDEAQLNHNYHFYSFTYKV